MRKVLLTIALAGTPVLSMANSTLVAKMPGQATMQIITEATTCNGGPIAIFMGPDGKNLDKTCNVKIGGDEITMVFAGYGKPLHMPRAQFLIVDVDHPDGGDQTEQKADLTGPQKNAVRSAMQYLRIAGFSRSGLIQQLSSSAGEGYEVTDATIAIDSLGVDWNEQAVRSAKQYLHIQGFSCRGLIQQLSSDAGEGYTVNQATYGAKQAGAC
jgi:hypothetical protein